MTTKQKLVLLELAAGITGWGWMIAGAGALYYAVRAIGFDGSWKDAGIAFAVSGVCKWLAKGFQENKMRVTFVARMVSEGMTEKDANDAWFRFIAPKAGNSQPAARQAESPEERTARIINEYASYIEANPTGDEIRDVSELPHPKETILEALLAEIRVEGDRGRREAIAACAAMLADYQSGVGETPLTSLGIDLSQPFDENVDVAALAKRVANNPDKGRYQEFLAKAKDERREILRKVEAAMAGS
ncbi:hypothetical protein [Oleispirillum naphthae]|uniref:hypothetical protein n=1 Tax=Oleispirillum naphthae TaxID=2838853 RepID=UPI0030822198